MVRAWTLCDRGHHDRAHRGVNRAVVARHRISADGRPISLGPGLHSAFVRPGLHYIPRPRPAGRWCFARGLGQLHRRPPVRENLMIKRFAAAIVMASLLWSPSITQTATAIYCYRGDPPAVYQACLAYNQGIGAQVANQRQLQNIQHQIKNVQAQMDALYGLIKTLNNQIALQQKLIAQTKASIFDLNRRIMLSEADL